MRWAIWGTTLSWVAARGENLYKDQKIPRLDRYSKVQWTTSYSMEDDSYCNGDWDTYSDNRLANCRRKLKHFEVSGQIEIPPQFTSFDANVVLINGATGEPSAQGSLNQEGIFEFRVTPGDYGLTVDHPNLTFSPLWIRVRDSPDDVRVYGYNWRGPDFSAPLGYPIELKPLGVPDFFEKREEFNPLDLFKSPMAIMMCFTLFMMFVIPKLQGSIAPEEYDEIKESLKGDSGPMAGFMRTMMGVKEDEAPPVPKIKAKGSK